MAQPPLRCSAAAWQPSGGILSRVAGERNRTVESEAAPGPKHRRRLRGIVAGKATSTMRQRGDGFTSRDITPGFWPCCAGYIHYPQSDILHSGRVSQTLQFPARNQTLMVKRVLKHSILQKPGQNATRLQVSHKRPSLLKKGGADERILLLLRLTRGV